MNHIAEILGISKKTIYVEFLNKEQLITESIIYDLQQRKEAFDKDEKKISNTMEALLFMSSEVVRYHSNICPAFYKDILRFPQAIKQMEDFRKEIEIRCYKHFLNGVEEGLFLSDQNYKQIAEIFVNEPSLTADNQSVLLIVFLRGVCTPAGELELKRIHLKKDPITNSPTYQNRLSIS